VLERRIGFAHLALIARTAEFVGEKFDETDLLRKAEKAELLSRFAEECMKARAMANPLAFIEEERRLHHARHLELTRAQEDGAVFVKGLLDAEAGAYLTTAIDALAVRLPHDERTAGQRRADALTEMARLTLDEGHAPVQGGVRPHVQVSATWEAAEGRPGAEPPLLNGETVITVEMFHRIATDCSFRRVLLDGRSMVIDVGRERRLFSGATRVAVERRYPQGCGVAGCPKPLRLTRLDHIEEWWRGGETNVENGRPLCLFHDRLRQEGWQFTQVIDPDDGSISWVPVPPPWFVPCPVDRIDDG